MLRSAFPAHSYKPHKNTSVLVGTVLKSKNLREKFSEKKILFAPVPCGASINKSSVSHFGPVRVRIFRFAHLSWPTNRSLHKLQFNKLKRCFSLSNRRWLVQIIQSSLILLPYGYTVFLSCWFCFVVQAFLACFHATLLAPLCLYMLLLVFPRSVFALLCFSNFSPYASTRPAVRFCSALPFAPVKFFARLCFALFSKFCYACFASQTSGLCSAFPLGSCKIFARLRFVLFRRFCFACFASQTSGLCSAFPSVPVLFYYSVTYVLRALPHKQRVCAVLFPRFLKVFCTLVFCFIIQSIMLCVFCLINIGFLQCYSLGSWKCFARLCFGLFFSKLLLCVLCLTNIGFVQCFSLGS